MKICLMLSVTLFFASSVFSQNDINRTLLWEISGKKLDKPSFLYGTIHIQDKRVFAFDSIVHQKLASCEAYAMEVLIDNVNTDEIKSAMLMKDSTLEQLISENDFAKLDSYFKAQIGVSVMMFNKMKPFFISSEMITPFLKSEMTEPLDMYFLSEAKKQNKKLLGIESWEEQMEVVDKIPLKQQAEMLIKSLTDTFTNDFKYDELIETYCNADLDKMITLLNDTLLPAEFNQLFIDDRNILMAKRIAKYINKQATFCAIGAGHLGGEKGVINLLRKKGYSVKPVYFQFIKE